MLPGYVVGPWIDIDIFFSPWPAWFLAQNLIDWNFIWNNLAVMSAMATGLPAGEPKAGRRTEAVAGQQPRARRCRRVPVKPIDNGPPVVVVVPPVCPPGTVMDDGVCRLPDSCRPGMVRVGNLCVFPTRPDPLPKPPVTDNPCAELSGIELRRCLHAHRPHGRRRQTAGDGSGYGYRRRPAGRQSTVVERRPDRTQPGWRRTGAGKPDVRIPNVIRPHGSGDRCAVKEPVQLPNRLPPTTSAPMRPNPSPVVMAPSGGGAQQDDGRRCAARSRAPAAADDRAGEEDAHAVSRLIVVKLSSNREETALPLPLAGEGGVGVSPRVI